MNGTDLPMMKKTKKAMRLQAARSASFGLKVLEFLIEWKAPIIN